MIIDIHTHNVSENMDVLLGAAEHNDIKKIVLLGDVLKYGYYPNETQVREINSFTGEIVRKYSEKCLGFCFLNPANNLEFITNEIDRCVKNFGFKGVKLEVSVNCRDERLYPIMQKLEEYNIPLLHHSWYKAGGNLPDESTPADIAFLGAKFPDVKIIMAHLAGCGVRGVLDIAPFENIYIDTSGGQPHSCLVEFALEKLGPERIIYGSDAPYRDFSVQLGRITGAEISNETKEMILGRNAERLLKI